MALIRCLFCFSIDLTSITSENGFYFCNPTLFIFFAVDSALL